MQTLKSESSILGPLCNQGKVWPAQGFLEPSLHSSYHVHVTLLVNPPTHLLLLVNPPAHLLLSHSCRTCTQRQSSAHCAVWCTEVDYRFNYWWRGCLSNLQSCICYVGGSGWERSVEGLWFRALWDPGVCRYGHPEGQRHVAEREESVSHWERWNFSVLTHSTVEQTGGCWLL